MSLTAKAELCPVCKGSGKYEGNTCHGCEGRGWLTLYILNEESQTIRLPQPSPAEIPYWLREVPTAPGGPGDGLPFWRIDAGGSYPERDCPIRFAVTRPKDSPCS